MKQKGPGQQDILEGELEDYQPYSSQLLLLFHFLEILQTSLNARGDLVYLVALKSKKDEQRKTVICTRHDIKEMEKRNTAVKLDDYLKNAILDK